jgi:hypothetical protein
LDIATRDLVPTQDRRKTDELLAATRSAPERCVQDGGSTVPGDREVDGVTVWPHWSAPVPDLREERPRDRAPRLSKLSAPDR